MEKFKTEFPYLVIKNQDHGLNTVIFQFATH